MKQIKRISSQNDNKLLDIWAIMTKEKGVPNWGPLFLSPFR